LTMPDVSLIRDADLKQELERHTRRNLLPKILALEVQLLIEEQVKRDSTDAERQAVLDAMPRERRRRAQVHDHFLNEE
ncbi:hypothetical protein ACXWOP_09770, partial [Streptococcus pyogenes]